MEGGGERRRGRGRGEGGREGEGGEGVEERRRGGRGGRERSGGGRREKERKGEGRGRERRRGERGGWEEERKGVGEKSWKEKKYCRTILDSNPRSFAPAHNNYANLKTVSTRPLLLLLTCGKWLSGCLRPYHTEYTSSRQITEVKQCWACPVLGWVTAWEQQVL